MADAATTVKKWSAKDISLTINGNEVDDYKSFKWQGEDEGVNHIVTPKKVAGFEFTAAEPKATLKVLTTSETLTTLREYKKNRTVFPVVYQSPYKLVTITNAVVGPIEEDEQAKETPTVTVSFLSMEIDVQDVKPDE